MKNKYNTDKFNFRNALKAKLLIGKTPLKRNDPIKDMQN